jgi:hypothetical protein
VLLLADALAEHAQELVLDNHGPGPPGGEAPSRVFHSGIAFVWRFCMGAQGA